MPVFNFVQDILGQNSPTNGFQANGSTRQSRIQPNLPGQSIRHVMRWLVPNQPIVEMYINPQSVKYNHKKLISKARTKGGFLFQYFGQDLISLSLNGETGTSGAEGLQVLENIYRNEQLSMDPYALFLSSQQDQTSLSVTGSAIGNALGGSIGSMIGGGIGSLLGQSIQQVQQPSLMQLAIVELYWCGKVYRGFFESFSSDESVTTLGMFNYSFEFTCFQVRGTAHNTQPFNRNPNFGAKSDNTPYSFNGDPNTSVYNIPETSSTITTGIVNLF